jgi:hypothetical protein
VNCIRCGTEFETHEHTGKIPFETRYCLSCVAVRVTERESEDIITEPIVEVPVRKPRRKRPIYGSIGSVQSGSLRNQDLIPSFLWEANRLHLTKDERKEVRHIEKAVNKVSNGQYGDSDAYWTDEVSAWHLEALFEILDAHSLPYFHFGAHEGDGSDFGWWLSSCIEEEFADASSNFAKCDGAKLPSNIKVSELADVPKGFTGEVLHVNDHGNTTLYSFSRGRAREIWSLV